jgi:nicotinamide riboside kinase
MNFTIKKFSILGERCSGTNFLEEAITNNFNIQYTSEYGNKHFFCYHDYSKKTDETLFIGIVRNPIYWINSFSKELHHVPEVNRKNLHDFLFNEFYSVINENDNSDINNIFIFNNKYYTHKYKINEKDLNYITDNKYKNIFEMRKVKNNYLTEVMPKKVKHYIFINYEDLLYNYNETLDIIKNNFYLIPKNDFYLKIKKYKKSERYNFVLQRQITIPFHTIKLIWNNLDKAQENNLGYIMGNDNEFFKEKYKLIKNVLHNSQDNQDNQDNSDNIPVNEGI